MANSRTRLLYVACAALLSVPALAAPPADIEQRIAQVQQLGEGQKLMPLAARMAKLKVPGVSIAVIHEGRIEWARGFGVVSVGGPPVTEDTLFQAASISKPVFALAALHQVDAGKLELDADVNEYLKSWKVPENKFTAEQKVTLRRLLSHSAGLTVGGFVGYEPGDPIPTTVEILNGLPPVNSPPVLVDWLPGSKLRYSGGGYVVAQLLLSDVTGEPLPKLLHDTVLAPLGMTHSTFEQPLPSARMGEAALPYLSNGKALANGPRIHPELAAAGLWTTPSDLARYALGVRAALAGESSVISAATAREMLTRVMGDWGLGPVLGGGTSRKLFAHSGGNFGYRCFLVAYEDGEGAVVMTNSDRGDEITEQVIRAVARVYGWPDFVGR